MAKLNKKYTIYSLCDPDSLIPFYVGKSINPKKRYRTHIGLNYKKSLKKTWLISLKRKNKLPYLDVLESNITEGMVNSREIFWINLCRKINPKLKNMTNGGDGGKTYAGRPVPIECSNGKSYNSVKDAAEDIGVSPSAISLILSGRNITAKGLYFWKSGEECPKLRNRKYRFNSIVCSNGKTYETIIQASKELNLSPDSISQCVRGLQNQTHGFSFIKVVK